MGHELRLFPDRSPCFMCRTFPPFRLQPPVAVPGDRSGFVPEPTARPAGRIPLGTKASLGLHHHSEAGHDNRPNRVRHPTDQRFTSSCSPPPLTRTQLLSVTKYRPYFDRDFHPSIRYTHKRTRSGTPYLTISLKFNRMSGTGYLTYETGLFSTPACLAPYD